VFTLSNTPIKFKTREKDSSITELIFQKLTQSEIHLHSIEAELTQYLAFLIQTREKEETPQLEKKGETIVVHITTIEKEHPFGG